MRTITGQCHCGNVRFRFEWPAAPRPIPVRACGCGFCTRLGAAWTSHPAGRLALEVVDADAVTVYRFGHETASFHVCSVCGIVAVATCRIDDELYAVVNVNTFEDVGPDELDRGSTDFEGEAGDERLARRRRNWTPTVASGFTP